MPRASKQVDWCLKKAEKEIEECRKLGKRPKHKGLLKVNPNREEANEHLRKSEENLKFATSLDSDKYGYKIVEAVFYCIYHCFLAIASKFGYESGNQTCTISLIEYLKEEKKIDLDQKFIEMMKYNDEQKDQKHPSIIEMREDYTYSSKISVGKERVAKLIEICKEIVHVTKEIVYHK